MLHLIHIQICLLVAHAMYGEGRGGGKAWTKRDVYSEGVAHEPLC